jgi:uncharacterized protein YjiS (DUF1127 family)
MLKTLRRRLSAWRVYNETYNELSRLSARELDDLGIGRADIPFIAKRAAEQL